MAKPLSEYGSAIFPLLRDQVQQLDLIPITVAAVCTILTLAHSAMMLILG